MINIKSRLRSVLNTSNHAISQIYLQLFGEKNGLIIFYLHAVFRDRKEVACDAIDPYANRAITVDHLKQLIEYFQEREYGFVAPSDILTGLDQQKKHVMLTFDDGYSNNQYCVPVLSDYGIPAVFFISSNHVKLNKSFWWDVIYRLRSKTATPNWKIRREIEFVKLMRHDAIEAYVIKNFGEKALVPAGDVDRPFTPAELKKFAEEKYVHIGNHTSDHAILTNCTPEELNTQIRGAQSSIYDMTGIIPEAISYPSGHYSTEVLTSAKEMGLKLGFTISRRKNYLPIDMTCENMCLSRFSLDGYTGLIKQFESARSDHMRLQHRSVDFLRRYAVGAENTR